MVRAGLFALFVAAPTTISVAKDVGGSALDFVGSAACAACHEAEFAAWRGSQHDLAMQEATDKTVLGDFDGETFTYGDLTSRFFERDGRFFVNTDGPDGKLADFEIRYTFGVTPLQQYLIALPDGRMQALGIAWDAPRKDKGGQRWFHLYPDQNLRAGNPLHWTGIDQTWNFMCAECHSTELHKNYDEARSTYATTWAEIDVACEACHGPGSAHVSWAERQSSVVPWGKGGDNGLTVHFDERKDVSWSIDPVSGSAPSQHATNQRHGVGDLRSVRFSGHQDRRAVAAGRAALADARARAAARRPVRGRRQESRRGLQLRALPAEQNVHGRRLL